MKRLFTIFAMAAALAIPGLAAAYSVQAQETVTVPKGETRPGTYYALGQVVTIDGDVDGDLVCAGQTIIINGTVRGDVICAGQNVTINGPVEGSVRLAGQMINVNGTVERNASLAAQSLALGDSARVAGDLGMLAQLADIKGRVAKDIHGSVDGLTIANEVGPVDIQLEGLILSGSAKVNGDLKYTSFNTQNIDGAKVAGEIKRSEPATAQRNDTTAADSLAERFYWILAALAVALAIIALAPRLAVSAGKAMRARPVVSLGWGLLVVLLAPLLVVVLMLTVIGIPLGLLTAAIWIVLMATSSVFAGIAVGQWFLERANWRTNSLLWAALIGIPFTVIVLSVPVLGPVLGLLAMWWAVGGLVLSTQLPRK